MYRDVGDGLLEMECTLAINSELLDHEAPLFYKYIVTSQHKGDSLPYEFLHGAQGGGRIVDRKLFIPKEKFTIKGNIHTCTFTCTCMHS